jgi:hypothetical protein
MSRERFPCGVDERPTPVLGSRSWRAGSDIPIAKYGTIDQSATRPAIVSALGVSVTTPSLVCAGPTPSVVGRSQFRRKNRKNQKNSFAARVCNWLQAGRSSFDRRDATPYPISMIRWGFLREPRSRYH